MVPRTPPRRCLQLRVKYTVYPPSQTYQQHALAGGGSGLWGSSCRPSACGRRCGPVPVACRLHGRWRVAPAARRLQPARATVPWVASQLQARVQPVQLLLAFGGGPPPHAIAQHSRPAPSRTARPTRCIPYRLQAVRSSWHCCAPPRRARYRLRARPVVRVGHAETARRHAMHHPRASAWRRDDAIRVRSSMATMATMATPRSRLSKILAARWGGWVVLTSGHSPGDFFFHFFF